MIPVIVDPRQVRMALVGRGRTAERPQGRRLGGGARRRSVVSVPPDPGVVPATTRVPS